MKIINTVETAQVANTYQNVLTYLELPDMYEVDYQKNINSLVIRYNSHDLSIDVSKIEEIVCSRTPCIRCKGVTITFFSSFIITQIL